MRPIDAEALLEQIDTERERLVKLGMLGAEHIVTHYVRNFIEDAPTVDRPQGKWKGYNEKKEDWLRTDGTPIFLVCDQCYGTVLNNGSAHWNYCPNCGARMKGADDE